MPNLVTTEVIADIEVIKSIINSSGNVDFNFIDPAPCKHTWNGINLTVEDTVISIIENMKNGRNYNIIDFTTFKQREFEQFTGMIENYYEYGYIHNMDFAKQEWGTKWNASSTNIDANFKSVNFNTAWSCPIPALVKLSRKFPDSRIDIKYADEDIGSNCGEFSLLNGEMFNENIAPEWSSLSYDEQLYWKTFALTVKDGMKMENNMNYSVQGIFILDGSGVMKELSLWDRFKYHLKIISLEALAKKYFP